MLMMITGAAGFIGSHAVARLVRDGHHVIAVDQLALDDALDVTDALNGAKVTYRQIDIGDEGRLRETIEGVDVVWHFAASADIPGGARRTGLDLASSVMGTRAVLEAMRGAGTPEIVFPSTSAVYGAEPPRPVPETHGPTLPTSLYGAGKAGAEALISAYCHLFGLRAWIFRLGNVVGGGMPRGVIRDFILKLSADPERLAVLGTGTQRKSYVLVDDVLDGMATLRDAHDLTGKAPCDVVNIAADGSLDVLTVASIVAGEMGLAPVVSTAGDGLSWPGDQPVVELDVAKAAGLGWQAAHSPARAVALAARRLVPALLGADR
ncbi:NAD-dependent epimerase/dehydratase family protein [Actinomadura rubrisoli]|nr:NAD-dependent epimerase/dehydratase family protein [Actinomadura rubrisoli]